MTRVRVDEAALRALVASAPGILRGMERVGEQVAQRAAAAAPKDSGAGAASIHAETVEHEVRVSWDRDHYYMVFPELGTSRMSARPFLRPALDATYTL